jgi:hypothetical protein
VRSATAFRPNDTVSLSVLLAASIALTGISGSDEPSYRRAHRVLFRVSELNPVRLDELYRDMSGGARFRNFRPRVHGERDQALNLQECGAHALPRLTSGAAPSRREMLSMFISKPRTCGEWGTK